MRCNLWNFLLSLERVLQGGFAVGDFSFAPFGLAFGRCDGKPGAGTGVQGCRG